MISAMLDGKKPPDLTITGFAKRLPYSWDMMPLDHQAHNLRS